MAVMAAMVAVMAAPAFASILGKPGAQKYCENSQAYLHNANAQGGPGVFCAWEPLNP
jgi:hypothetical protein